MKKTDTLLKEYTTKLSDDNLKFLNSRLSQRLGGDVPEVLDFVSQSGEMDRWFHSAKGSWELYDMVDSLYKHVEQECDYRFND
jgi:hypothetical protein